MWNLFIIAQVGCFCLNFRFFRSLRHATLRWAISLTWEDSTQITVVVKKFLCIVKGSSKNKVKWVRSDGLDPVFFPS